MHMVMASVQDIRDGRKAAYVVHWIVLRYSVLKEKKKFMRYSLRTSEVCCPTEEKGSRKHDIKVSGFDGWHQIGTQKRTKGSSGE